MISLRRVVAGSVRDAKKENKKAGKMEWKEIAWATTPEYGIEAERWKKKGFWQIDCQAETEMAQERHKNKFAIIHFDLSSGMRIGKASRRDTPPASG